jgi:hypothetical protein
VQYRDGALFTTVHSTSAICRKVHHHQAPVTRNASPTPSAELAETMKHGLVAAIIRTSRVAINEREHRKQVFESIG